MTSKAVKRAHRLENHIPGTRADHRRRDLAELAGIRKEHEREQEEQKNRRASARAKAVRNRVATKKQAEKEERRKNGIPEPSRFVRASQQRISMFFDKGQKQTEDEYTVPTPAVIKASIPSLDNRIVPKNTFGIKAKLS
jgi:hypothetical protein